MYSINRQCLWLSLAVEMYVADTLTTQNIYVSGWKLVYFIFLKAMASATIPPRPVRDTPQAVTIRACIFGSPVVYFPINIHLHQTQLESAGGERFAGQPNTRQPPGKNHWPGEMEKGVL